MLNTISAAVLALFALAGASHAQSDTPYLVEHFARLPAGVGASLSPDGTRAAYIANVEENRFVVVQTIATGAQRAVDISNMRGYGTFWADNDTLMARVGRAADIFYISGDVDYQALISIDTTDMQSSQLIRNRGNLGFNQNTSLVVGWDENHTRMLMPLRDDDQNLNLYSVDPSAGHSRSTVARGNENTRYWQADPNGERFVRVDYSPTTDRLRLAIEENERWRELLDERQPLIELSVQGFSSDGEAIIISRFDDEWPYTRLLQRLNISDGTLGEVVYQDEVYDFDLVRLDPHLGSVAGVDIEREQRETIWFDPELAQIQASLEASFPSATVSLVDWTQDRNTFLILVYRNDQAPIYFVIDLAAQNASALRYSYPELQTASLPTRRHITIPARDGASIPAYLTLPEGDGPHPFVVLVHGGPASRDTGGFDYMAHFLASRGYGVLQPQFRGSAGFGGLWEASGWGEWGIGIMQHDVTDSANFLKDYQLATEICIAGGSYGGYAALAGSVFTPDTFDCAVSINGVADPAGMIDYDSARYGQDSQSVRYWIRNFSGEQRERLPERLIQPFSPIDHVENIQIPILLLHGEEDSVVPVRQSRAMRRTLERAGKTVRYVELDGGDHWLFEYETRVHVLEELDTFLAEHLRPD